MNGSDRPVFEDDGDHHHGPYPGIKKLDHARITGLDFFNIGEFDNDRRAGVNGFLAEGSGQGRGFPVLFSGDRLALVLGNPLDIPFFIDDDVSHHQTVEGD